MVHHRYHARNQGISLLHLRNECNVLRAILYQHSIQASAQQVENVSKEVNGRKYLTVGEAGKEIDALARSA